MRRSSARFAGSSGLGRATHNREADTLAHDTGVGHHISLRQVGACLFPHRSQERFMLVSLRRSINARRLAAAAGLTMVAAAPAAAQGAAALPPAKDLIAKFVAATNATAVMA